LNLSIPKINLVLKLPFLNCHLPIVWTFACHMGIDPSISLIETLTLGHRYWFQCPTCRISNLRVWGAVQNLDADMMAYHFTYRVKLLFEINISRLFQ